MYSPLIESFTPCAVANAAFNYVVWTHFNSDSEIQKIFNTMCWLNLFVAAGLAYVEYRNPATLHPKDDHTKKIALHALALGSIGAVVSHLCYRQLASLS